MDDLQKDLSKKFLEIVATRKKGVEDHVEGAKTTKTKALTQQVYHGGLDAIIEEFFRNTRLYT